jgi:excinuclease ABC subunit C
MERRAAEAGILEIGRVLDLGKPPRVIEAFDISNISGTFSVASMVCFERGLPNRHRYRLFRIRTVQGADDPGMIREVVRRRFSRLDREKGRAPDLVLVDGGIAQVRAAAGEIAALGLGDLPAAGLAKRFEEIYRPNSAKPVRLAGDSPALLVLRAVRDEAHRFALTYHRRLRSRRIRESVLDDVPGIGKVRKRLLLEHFGSVTRLLAATPGEIASVSGFGVKTAQEVYEGLIRLRRL